MQSISKSNDPTCKRIFFADRISIFAVRFVRLVAINNQFVDYAFLFFLFIDAFVFLLGILVRNTMTPVETQYIRGHTPQLGATGKKPI